MKRPWFAIVWFLIWGSFQAFAVASVFAGTWQKPEAFPDEAYFSLVYPDMFFIPLYLLSAALLLRRHWLGSILAFVAGGGVIYVMIYLLALSGASDAVNLIADGIFLLCIAHITLAGGVLCQSPKGGLTKRAEADEAGLRMEPRSLAH